jgi:hypothetical protein
VEQVEFPVLEDIRKAKSCQFHDMLLALIVLMKSPVAYALGDEQLGEKLHQEKETLNKLLQEATKFVNESLDNPDSGTPSAKLRAGIQS